MRFLVLVKADKNSEAGTMPDRKLLAEMGKFNEEPARAGELLAGDGLQPNSKGARVTFAGGKTSVAKGPFPEVDPLVAGFWMYQARSLEEAVAWLKRAVQGG
jgi:hypothetical protein